MRQILINCFAVLLLILCALSSRAQDKPKAEDLLKDFESSLDSGQAPPRGQRTMPGLNTVPEQPATADPAQDSIRFQRQLQQYDFEAYHQRRSFTWQYYSSICIFIMVMLIVGMGLLLSFKQFKLTEKQVLGRLPAHLSGSAPSMPSNTNVETKKVTEKQTGGDAENPAETVSTVQTSATTIEVGKDGLKINTAVIGLAILFLSLVFFFLYLKYVYVIEVVNTGH